MKFLNEVKIGSAPNLHLHDITLCFYTNHYCQLYPTGKRIWIRHLRDDVLSVLSSLVWRISDAFRFVGRQYGADDCRAQLAIHPLGLNGQGSTFQYRGFLSGYRIPEYAEQ